MRKIKKVECFQAYLSLWAIICVEEVEEPLRMVWIQERKTCNIVLTSG